MSKTFKIEVTEQQLQVIRTALLETRWEESDRFGMPVKKTLIDCINQTLLEEPYDREMLHGFAL